MRILHITTGLNLGGVEMTLYRLLKHGRKDLEPTVISLLPQGVTGDRILDLGVPVESLQLSRSTPNPIKVALLARRIAELQPAVIQTWMYHANLLGGVAATVAGARKRIVWGIHHSNLSRAHNRRRTLAIASLCNRLSHHIPQKIIFCSNASLAIHLQRGCAIEKSMVIPNGFDTQKFVPDFALRAETRRALGLVEQDLVIGMVARFDPQKDYTNFAHAARFFRQRYGRFKIVLAGPGITSNNDALTDLLAAAGVLDICSLLGPQENIPALLNALDIFTLSSCGEAFPNALGEALACAIPAATTDVGDCAAIVGHAGITVPAQSPEALADAWYRLAVMPQYRRQALGLLGRKRICKDFAIESVAHRYATVYDQVLKAAVAQVPKSLKHRVEAP